MRPSAPNRGWQIDMTSFALAAGELREVADRTKGGSLRGGEPVVDLEAFRKQVQTKKPVNPTTYWPLTRTGWTGLEGVR